MAVTDSPRRVSQRHVAATAGPRCAAYAACSELVASPHEVDPQLALRDRLGLGRALGYAQPLDPLIAAVCGAELGQLRKEFSGLFEVGDDGPPVPIREALQPGASVAVREEIVRFYEHFGYVLGEQFAWQPDHLSLELEFMHFLCFHEANAVDEAAALPWQLAQADFTARHVVTWIPALAERVGKLAPTSLYARVLAGVRDFVTADGAWQTSTVSDADSRPV